MRALLASLVLLTFAGCAGNRLTLANADGGKAYILQQGQVLELQLRSNPTTGYSWQLQPGGEVLQRVAMTFLPDPHEATVVGSGGTEIWRFNAVKTGRQILRFEYRRPWEKDTPAAETLSYDITVP